MEIRFEGQAQAARRTYLVPPGDRVALNLDDAYGETSGVLANAAVRVACDQDCGPLVALWHAPIALGVVPTVYAVPMTCQL